VRVVNLACAEVIERHTAENIKKWIESQLEVYQIQSIQVFVINVDSAANISAAVRKIIEDLNDKILRITSDDSPLRDEDARKLEDSLNGDFEDQESLADLWDDTINFVPDGVAESSFLINCSVHKVNY
jgi:hypothetical protein